MNRQLDRDRGKGGDEEKVCTGSEGARKDETSLQQSGAVKAPGELRKKLRRENWKHRNTRELSISFHLTLWKDFSTMSEEGDSISSNR